MSDMPQLGQICWNELATANVQKAKEFYGKVFGWEFADQQMGDMTYTMIKANGKDLGGIWAIPTDKQKEIPPHWIAYISVANLDEALKSAGESGASIVKPSATVGDCGRFAIIVDPTGAHIALWESLKACE